MKPVKQSTNATPPTVQAKSSNQASKKKTAASLHSSATTQAAASTATNHRPQDSKVPTKKSEKKTTKQQKRLPSAPKADELHPVNLSAIDPAIQSVTAPSGKKKSTSGNSRQLDTNFSTSASLRPAGPTESEKKEADEKLRETIRDIYWAKATPAELEARRRADEVKEEMKEGAAVFPFQENELDARLRAVGGLVPEKVVSYNPYGADVLGVDAETQKPVSYDILEARHARFKGWVPNNSAATKKTPSPAQKPVVVPLPRSLSLSASMSTPPPAPGSALVSPTMSATAPQVASLYGLSTSDSSVALSSVGGGFLASDDTTSPLESGTFEGGETVALNHLFVSSFNSSGYNCHQHNAAAAQYPLYPAVPPHPCLGQPASAQKLNASSPLHATQPAPTLFAPTSVSTSTTSNTTSAASESSEEEEDANRSYFGAPAPGTGHVDSEGEAHAEPEKETPTVAPTTHRGDSILVHHPCRAVSVYSYLRFLAQAMFKRTSRWSRYSVSQICFMTNVKKRYPQLVKVCMCDGKTPGRPRPAKRTAASATTSTDESATSPSSSTEELQQEPEEEPPFDIEQPLTWENFFHYALNVHKYTYTDCQIREANALFVSPNEARLASKHLLNPIEVYREYDLRERDANALDGIVHLAWEYYQGMLELDNLNICATVSHEKLLPEFSKAVACGRYFTASTTGAASKCELKAILRALIPLFTPPPGSVESRDQGQLNRNLSISVVREAIREYCAKRRHTEILANCRLESTTRERRSQLANNRFDRKIQTKAVLRLVKDVSTEFSGERSPTCSTTSSSIEPYLLHDKKK